MKALTATEEQALQAVAAALRADPAALRALINFESGWKPDAKNPFSGARGLIQFMHTTARDMGYKDADEIVSKYPTIEAQLRNPVLAYLSKYKPFPTEQSLYMAVFYPAARQWPPNQLFPENVQKVNPGIKTPLDYVNYVRRNAGMQLIKSAALGLPLILAVAAAAYYLVIKPRFS